VSPDDAGGGRPAWRRCRGDGGFTLPELIVVVGLLGVVVAMVYASMEVFLRLSSRTESGSIAVSNARTAMERVTRQIRAANPIEALADPAAYATKISFSVHCSTPGVQSCGTDNLRQVAYELVGHELVETVGTTSAPILGPEGPSSLPLSGRRGAVVNGASQPVFRYFQQDGQPLSPSTVPSTTFRDCTRSVELHLVVVAQSGASERVDLTTRVDLRNFNEVAGC
jgi:prepilin-type N-terminal cleavage/methylation domain-containing protein